MAERTAGFPSLKGALASALAGVEADISAGQRGNRDGTLTAAGFRDRLDNGRKVAIQILEFFDKSGVTVRSGDERRVRMDRLGLFGRVRQELSDR